MPREFLNRPNEHWALLRSTHQRNTKLAVFVHGFHGNYLGTWGNLAELLSAHGDAPPFDDWDYVFVGYQTTKVETYLDIAGRLRSEIEPALGGHAPYGSAYTKFALLGHSLGTLGIRQLLCDASAHPKGFVKAVHSVTLFGTPLAGSIWARFALGHAVAKALEVNNPQLRMLRAWVATAYGHAWQWPRALVIIGQDDQVVGDKIAGFVDWAGDAKVMPVPSDHLKLVKPTSWNGAKVVDLLDRALR